jgi:hypothetical protein
MKSRCLQFYHIYPEIFATVSQELDLSNGIEAFPQYLMNPKIRQLPTDKFNGKYLSRQLDKVRRINRADITHYHFWRIR